MARVRTALVTGLSVAAMLVASAAPAMAHRETAPKHGSDEAFVDATHLAITACDREDDGNGVRAEYYTFGSPNTLRSVGDANGSASGCGTELSEDLWEIQRFRVCEATKGCADWEWTDS
jgi:hypothetical protein